MLPALLFPQKTEPPPEEANSIKTSADTWYYTVKFSSYRITVKQSDKIHLSGAILWRMVGLKDPERSSENKMIKIRWDTI